MTKPHWTQTPEGKLKLAKVMRKAHRKVKKSGRKWKAASGERSEPKPVANAKVSDLRSAIIYLKQAERSVRNLSRPTSYAELLGMLALRALTGEAD